MAITPEQDRRLAGLMSQACQGDRKAYNELLEILCEILQGFLTRRLGPGPDMEDVLQEVLVSVHGARQTYDPNKPFAPWLFAIARYRICDHWRKASRKLDKNELDGEAAEIGEPPEKEWQLGDRLARSLDRLPEVQRKVVDLLKLRGFTIREAAREMKMSESALKVTAHRAYKTLRREYETENEG